MSNWLRGEWTTVVAEDLTKSWLGGHKAAYFRCQFCGHKFEVGDEFRCIFTNFANWKETGIPGGNPLTCRVCNPDGTLEEMYEKWKEMHRALDVFIKDPRYWWYFKRWSA